MNVTARPLLLCVDDEPSLLQSLDRLFKPHFEVLTLTSARAALGLLERRNDCAIVLSDYRMPEMNGLDFLREVRGLCPLAARAILSGQMDLANVSAAINRADIHKFILKPWENEYLLLQMSEALQLHRAFCDRAHFEHLALTDPVTSVGNHRAFQDRLRSAIESGGPGFALVMFDVDHFKRYNDRFGHPAGDQLLRQMATRLSISAGEGAHVARYGGEEFTVILPTAELALARTFAEDVRTFFERDPVAVTVSAGLALYPGHGITQDQLITAADQALYRAKAAGRNRVFAADEG